MFEIDPASLILTNGLVSLTLAVVLLVSRIGMEAEGRGIMTWVLADLAMTVARMVAAATIVGLPMTQGLAFPVLPGALALMGIVGHAQALRSVAGKLVHGRTVLMQALGLGLLFYVGGAHMDTVTQRLRWFDGMIWCGSAVTLWILRPVLNFWGARLIAAVMMLALTYQSLRFAALLLNIPIELPPEAATNLRAYVRPLAMVVDLMVALFVTCGFVLLLQERLRARIEHLMVTDALTGAFNRRGVMPLLISALSQANRQARSLSVVMLDLDHFKRINDLHGHTIGDQVLASFSALVSTKLRRSDILGRWGGEEFLLLLPDTGLLGARSLAERLREFVAHEPLTDSALRITVSAGIACFEGTGKHEPIQHAQALMHLLDTADKRLYLAKRQRNCVVITNEE